jgi:predicted HAD superfamily Cof-like phosphohydrolase
MNISCIHGHRWYSPAAPQCVVLLDGMKQHYVITASEEEGWIEYDLPEPTRQSGHVEILLKPSFARHQTPNFLRVADWLTRAGKEVRNPGHVSLQVGCMLEEVAEFLEEINPSEGSVIDLECAIERVHRFATDLKQGRAMAFKDPAAALDALCDIDVTINGVAFLAGWNKLQADLAVLNANDDKFVDGLPVILPSGKIGKREGWEAPDLSEFV